MWGIQGINKDAVSTFNSSDIGQIIWDRSFDISKEKAQLNVHNFCQEIKNSTLVFKNSTVSCWTDNFKAFLTQEKEHFPLKVKIDKNSTKSEK